MLSSLCLTIVLLLSPAFARSTHDTDRGSEFLASLLTEGSLGEAQCDAFVKTVAERNRRTVIQGIPKLDGTYVSQRCETRKGPEYVLRSLSFYEDPLSLRLVTFYYFNADCSTPTRTTVLSGNWDNVTNTLSETSLKLIAFSDSDYLNLERSIERQCHKRRTPLQKKRQQKRREYVLKESAFESCPDVAKEYLPIITSFITQTRSGAGRILRELFIVSDNSSADHQVPLLHADQRHDGCPICHKLSFAQPYQPPEMRPMPGLPPQIGGEWVSELCEAVNMTSFRTRRVTFSPSEALWAAETTFFADPTCANHSAITFSTGNYSVLGGGKETRTVDGAYDLDMTEHCTCLEFLAAGFSSNRVHRKFPPKCHSHNQANQPGCSRNILSRPTIFKIIFDRQASPLLLLGEGGTAASFQLPLVQCSSSPNLLSSVHS